MSDVQEFINSYLAHYASEFYDPAKAHEYYLKNRELKGRRSGSGLKTEAKKQAWSYAKNQIEEAKKRDLKEAAAELKMDIQKLRDGASTHREAIRTYLKALLKNISDKQQKTALRISNRHKLQAERIAKEASRKIDALPPIPEGISKEQRVKLVAKRAEEVARIRGESNKAREALSKETSSKRSSLSEETSKSREKEREAAAVTREKVSSDLKDAVDKGRAYYEQVKEKVKAKYEAALDKEYNAIRQKV